MRRLPTSSSLTLPLEDRKKHTEEDATIEEAEHEARLGGIVQLTLTPRLKLRIVRALSIEKLPIKTTPPNAKFFSWGPFLPSSNPLSLSNYRKKPLALSNATPLISSIINSREDRFSCLETVFSIFTLFSIDYFHVSKMSNYAWECPNYASSPTRGQSSHGQEGDV
jgi:hypothetical protein